MEHLLHCLYGVDAPEVEHTHSASVTYCLKAD